MKATDKASAKANTNPAVLCDFDDTVAAQNVAEMLLEHFGDDQWRSLRQQFRQGLLTLKEYQELSFAEVTVSREAMETLVKDKANLRPHFKELHSYCQAYHIPLAIVSHGLDFYIKALLEKEGQEGISTFAVATEYTPDGLNYTYTYSWEECWQSGNCKCAILRRYKEMGHTILYAGDGPSDYCPATREADIVFARSHLAQQCRQQQVPFVEFEDFRTVLEKLKNITKRPSGRYQG